MKEISRHPFSFEFGRGIGQGKDSTVRAELHNGTRGQEDPDWVTKYPSGRKRFKTADEAFLAAQYQKKKYELFRYFLGDFIPESYFIVGPRDVTGGQGVRKDMSPTNYTRQRRVPQTQLSDLTREQFQDPILLANLHELIAGVIFMNRIANRVNDHVPAKDRVDVRLDLGQLSQVMKDRRNLEQMDPHGFGVDVLFTPNVSVDTETMDLYCFDFGSFQQKNDKVPGERAWSDGKEATMRQIIALAERERAFDAEEADFIQAAE